MLEALLPVVGTIGQAWTLAGITAARKNFVANRLDREIGHHLVAVRGRVHKGKRGKGWLRTQWYDMTEKGKLKRCARCVL
mgnify:CR=1 FL=1